MATECSRSLFAALALMALLLLLPNIAAAQCPPGQRMVGVRNNGQITYPICAPDNSSSGTASQGYDYPVAPAAMRWYALALHPNAVGAWIAKQHRSQPSAEKAALDACTNAMGPGCTLNAAIGNGWLAAVRDSENHTWIGSGARRRDATGMAMEYCKTEGGGHCEVIQTEGASAMMEFIGVRDMMPTSIDAPKGQFRRTWAAIAYIDGSHPDSPFDDAVWVKGGFPDHRAAADALLQQCERESRLKCKVMTNASNFTGMAYVQERERSYSAFRKGGRNEAELRAALQAECRAKDKPCTVVLTYDATRTDSLRIHLESEAWRQSGGRMGVAPVARAE